VEHKTGTSGEEQGIAAATNDIGLITLPDGERLAVAVFLSDSTADDAGRDRAIARASLAIYQAAASGAASR
jgi:beta-lactamase class A